MSYVYVIAVGGDDGPFSAPVKIGISDDPENRLKDIRPCSPLGISLAATFKVRNKNTARAIERAAHRALDDYHLDYEWFGVSPDTAILVLEGLV